LAGILLEAEKDRDRRTQAAFSCEETFFARDPDGFGTAQAARRKKGFSFPAERFSRD